MRLRRVLAVAVVSGSACGVFDTQLTSETEQEIAVVNDNPFTFTMASAPHMFTVGVASSTDNDNIVSIRPTNAQPCPNYILSTPGLPGTPQHICGTNPNNDPTILGCPKVYTFSVTYIGNMNNDNCTLDIAWAHVGSGGGSGSGSGSGVSSGIEQLALSTNIVVPSMTLSPSTHDFGQLGTMTTSMPATAVTLTNNGTIPLTITGMITGAGASAFAVSPPALLAMHTLPVGNANVFSVTCSPQAVQTYLASLDISSAEGGLMRSTSLLCEGVSTTIAITPTQVQFDPTLVGRAPPTVPITISALASTPPMSKFESATLDAMAMQNEVTIVSQPNAGDLVSGGLVVTLAYAATTQFDPGTLGKLAIKVSSDSMPRQVGISGEAQIGLVGTSPQKIDLGSVCVSGTASVDVEVFANGPGTINLTRPGQPATPFSYTTTNTFPVLLKGNHVGPSAMLNVAITHPSLADGSATLSLPTDIPNAAPYDVPIVANVLEDGIAATPPIVHFGSVDPNGSTSGHEIRLTNCGTTDLDVTAAKIVGANANEFGLVSPTDPRTTLKPTEHETFLVIMSADKQHGDKSAALHIDYTNGSSDTPLDGTISGTSPRETYYGCDVAAGGSSAGFVIAASLFARRRRRRVGGSPTQPAS